MSKIKACWEIKHCGRTPGGSNVKELGICPAYPNNGHSCWVVAGTFCRGEVQGSYAKKVAHCSACEVYKAYSTSFGSSKDEFKDQFPKEFASCRKYLSDLAKGNSK